MPDTEFLDEIVGETENSNEAQEATKASEQDELINEKVSQALTQKEKGFYNEMRTERMKRQEVQSQLDQLRGTVAAILQQRQQATTPVAETTRKFNGLPISETEDGDLYLDESYLQKMVQPYEEKIKNLEMVLQQTAQTRNMDVQRSQMESEAERVKAAIVGENESYGPAYQKYQAARQWANTKVVEFQKDNGIGGQMSPGQALDYVFNDDLEREFNQKFPGVPLEEVVLAEESKRNFTRMLKTLAKSSDLQPQNTTQGEKFKKLLRKPSGLGSMPNAKAGHVSTAEKMADFSTDDIFNLSDAQIDALHKALRDEEKLEGLTWK